jgi:hypothetical protein
MWAPPRPFFQGAFFDPKKTDFEMESRFFDRDEMLFCIFTVPENERALLECVCAGVARFFVVQQTQMEKIYTNFN